MAIPDRPPDWNATLATLGAKGPDGLGRLFARGVRSDVDGAYLHWDDLRRRKPPEGLSREEWWAALRIARVSASADLPLRDAQQRPFSFVRADALFRALHPVDRALGNQQLVEDPSGLNAANKERFIARSLVEEAISSSLLEGAATTRKIAEAMLREGRQPRTNDERMILNNHRAMQLVRRSRKEPLTPELLLELQRTLTVGTLPPDEVGRFRRDDETVRVEDHATGEGLHLPPPAKELPKRIEALCAFANADDTKDFVHPVVRAIALHFMLGYDHPFVDGNGRTARAVFYWSMLRNGYWMAEFLSISTVIYRARAQYGRAFLLTETDGGDLTYFLLHQLDVLKRATDELLRYVAQKSKEVQDVDAILREAGDLNLRQRGLLAHAIRHPGATYRIDAHQKEYGVVYQTARTDLLDLEARGLLASRKVGRALVFQPTPSMERRLRRAR